MARTDLIRITGIPEVTAMLKNLPKALVYVAFADALSAAAQVILQELVARTPIGKVYLWNDEAFNWTEADTGALRDAAMFVTEIDAEGRGGTVHIGFGKEGRKALWIEYGHIIVGHKPGKRHLGVQPPRPFMRPALDASAEQAIDAFSETLQADLDKAVLVSKR